MSAYVASSAVAHQKNHTEKRIQKRNKMKKTKKKKETKRSKWQKRCGMFKLLFVFSVLFSRVNASLGIFFLLVAFIAFATTADVVVVVGGGVVSCHSYDTVADRQPERQRDTLF